MESGSTQPGSSVPERGVSTQRTKKRRTSHQSSSSTTDKAEMGVPLTAVRRASTKSSPRRTSSREMTPPEEVRLTKTGRVSKANKGQRVHECDECMNVYTRAEHLRRHKQNHKPGTFPCDFPGCTKSFNRQDLLIRHRTRHDENASATDTQHSPGRHGSSGEGINPLAPVHSHDTSTTEELEVESKIPMSRDSPSQAATQQTSNARIQKRLAHVAHQYSRQLLPMPVGGYGNETEGTGYQSDSSSISYPQPSYASPMLYDSLELPYHLPHLERKRQPSDASLIEYSLPPYTSQSPASSGPSTSVPLFFGDSLTGPALDYFGAFSSSETSFQNVMAPYADDMTDIQLLPEGWDTNVKPEATVPHSFAQIAPLKHIMEDPVQTANDRYLEAYWRHIHPLFPVVHRPTFSPQNATLLLKTAMTALGASSRRTLHSKTHSKTAHQQCVNILRTTLDASQLSLVPDLQAVLLVEIFSIFKARRHPLYLSAIFQQAYHNLAQDPEAYGNGSTLVPFAESLPVDALCLMPGFPNTSLYPSESESKQRLLAAYYIVDQHHAALFGRNPCRNLFVNGLDLPMPRPQAFWDTPNDTHDSPAESVHASSWATPPDVTSDHIDQLKYDTFQARLILTMMTDSNRPIPTYGQNIAIASGLDIPSMLKANPTLGFAYHTAMLCKSTPLRELLAVAGESWVVGEKLPTQAEHIDAQLTSVRWAQASSGYNMSSVNDDEHFSIHEALKHTIMILQIHQWHGSSIRLVVQEWALFLASIVIWARAYTTSTTARRMSSASFPESDVSFAELQQSIPAIIAAGPEAHVGLGAARMVLMWTRNKLQEAATMQSCGLTSIALDVLDKLITRGSEPGWFGS